MRLVKRIGLFIGMTAFWLGAALATACEDPIQEPDFWPKFKKESRDCWRWIMESVWRGWMEMR